MSKFILFFFIGAAGFLVYWGYSKGKISANKEYLEHDAALYEYLQTTEKALAIYYRQNDTLPKSLNDLHDIITKNKSDREEYLNFRDGFKKFSLEYNAISSSSYELCAQFYKNFSDQKLSETPDRFARFKQKKELYKKGRNCFTTQL